MGEKPAQAPAPWNDVRKETVGQQLMIFSRKRFWQASREYHNHMTLQFDRQERGKGKTLLVKQYFICYDHQTDFTINHL